MSQLVRGFSLGPRSGLLAEVFIPELFGGLLFGPSLGGLCQLFFDQLTSLNWSFGNLLHNLLLGRRLSPFF